jgi:hypothetical protein
MRVNQSHICPSNASVDEGFITSFDFAAHAECRRELGTALLEFIGRVRRIYPTQESQAACDEIAELVASARGPAVLGDELQLVLAFEGRVA